MYERLPALLLVHLLGAGAAAAGTATGPAAPQAQHRTATSATARSPGAGPVEAKDLAGEQPPPPGSPADQALWRSALDAGNQIVIERARAGRVQIRLKNGRYPERLSAMAKQDAAEAAPRAEELRQRLEEAWGRNYTLLTSRWPVDPTRGCGYEALTFYTALGSRDTPSDRAALAAARADVEACLGKALPALQTMKASTDRLEAVAAEVDAALAAVGLGSPTSAPAAGQREGAGEDPAAPPAARPGAR